MSLMFRMMGFERAAFEGDVREHPKEWRGVHGLWDLVRLATARGELELPRGLDNVLTAGRCISGTHEALSSYRVMPVAMAVGQAAGVCAALAARAGATPRALAVTDVQRGLLRQGADLRGVAPA
jgi:hypothetical protein